MRDRNFLKSILPLTPELNAILNRVFEMDPSKRATVQELKEMILACDRLTTLQPVPQLYSPPYSPITYHQDATNGHVYAQEDPLDNIPQLPSPLISPPSYTFTRPLSPRLSQFSNGSSESDCGSVFSDVSSASSASSISSYEYHQQQHTSFSKIVGSSTPQHHQYVPPSPGWYAIPSQIHRMANYLQSFQHAPMPQIQVY